MDRKPKQRAGEELARVSWLRRDPRGALTVDRYREDWRDLAWLQVLGEVRVVPVEEGAAALDALTRRYPVYRDEPPPGPLLELQPRRCLCWRAAG